MKNSSFNIAALKADNGKTFAGMLRLILLPLVLFVSGLFSVAEAQVVVGNSQSNQTTSKSLTITKPTGLQVGDLMIVNLNMRKGATVPTALAGFTERVKYNHATPERYVWIGFKVANATDVLVSTTGYTFQNTGDDNSLEHWAGAITAFRNVNTTTNGGIEVVGTHFAASNNNPLAPTSINTVTNNDMVVFMGQVQAIDFITTNPTTTGAWRLGGAAGTVMNQLYLVNPTGSGAICGVGAASLTRPTAGASGAGHKTTEDGRKAGILMSLKAITCAVSATVAKTDVTCFGTNNGTITLSTPTGATSYEYRLDAGTWQTSSSFTGLAPATYSVQIRDANNTSCAVTLGNQTITQPASAVSGTISSQTNVGCNGLSTGSFTVTGSGGTGAFTYSLNGGAYSGTNTFTNRPAGNYTVIVRDANECTSSTVNVTITEPPVLTATITQSNISCFNVSTGTITVSNPAGGAGVAYETSINGTNWFAVSATTPYQFTGLAAGSYTVRLRNAASSGALPTLFNTGVNGSGVALSVDNTIDPHYTLIQSADPAFPGPNAYFKPRNPAWLDPGASPVRWIYPGTTDVNPAGNYTYRTKFDLSGRTPGTASLSGRFAVDNSLVSVRLNGTSIGAVPAGSLGAWTNLPNITSGFVAGVNTLDFEINNINNGSNNPTALMVEISGTATVSSLCGTTIGTIILAEPASAVSGTISSQSNVLCFGQSTGAVTVAGSGGTGPYTFSIDAGGSYQNSGTFTGRAQGAFTVIVRDANLCTVNVSGTITQPAAALAVTPTVTQPSCFAFGGITLNVTGGTEPYTYDWADVSGTNNPKDRSGLAAGAYSVVVSDANGCTVSSGTLTLTAPTGCAPVTVCKSGGPASVFSVDPDPSITLYTWTVPSGATITAGQGTNQISVNWSGVIAGTYQVCVTAANACGTTAQTCQDVNVINPPVATATASAACVGSNIQLNASGGTTYQWSGPGGFTSSQANPVIPNASATNNGAYTVTVANANGCTASQTLNITVTEPPSLSGAVTMSSCDLPVGAVILTVTPPGTYTYAWSNGAISKDISGLAPGNYTVIVTNAAACTTTATYPVNTVPGPVPTATVQNIACFGGNTGSIGSVNVSGGIAPITYLWSGPNGYSSANINITNLAAGTYNLTVTDVNGCAGGLTRTITQAAAISINQSRTNVSCFNGTNGTIDLTVTGGTGEYGYSWTKNGSAFPLGNNLQDLTGLGAGTYIVTVTDAANCTATATVTITEPASAVSGTPVVTNVSCFGGATGQVVLTPAGGTAPYTYAWSRTGGGFSATTKDISNRTAGVYSVIITDALGCTSTINNIEITQPTQITLVAPVVTAVNCFGGSTGSISVTASGGTGTLTYQWSNGGITNSITGLSAGTYSVIVTDANGCTVNSGNIVVGQPAAALTVSATAAAVDCFGASTGGVTTTVNGGTTDYTYLWSNTATTPALTNVAAGNYQVTVTDAKGCTAVSTATVTSPADIELSGAVSNVLCNGAATGSITLSVTGGAGSFTYNWGGGITSQDRTGLAAGTYTVTVTDGNNCTNTKSFTITQPSPIVLSMVNTNISCFGGSDGSINLSVAGGVGPYTFAWSTGAITEDVTGLAAGTHTVTVTDANGCEAMLTSDPIAQPALLTLAATVNKNVNCPNGADGGATVVPTGGTGPYTYEWSDGGTGAIRANLKAGTYIINVFDNAGCTAFTNVTITEPDPILLFAEVSNTSGCAAVSSGAINLTVQNGTGLLQYSWSGPDGFTATSQNISNLAGGVYTVNVTDANSCTAQLTETIASAPALTLALAQSDINCSGFPNNNNGEVFALPSGGTPGYTYLWNTGATTSSLSGLGAGTYNVTVTDASGCTAFSSTTLAATSCVAPVAVNDLYTQCTDAVINGNAATNDNIQGVPINEMLFEVSGAPAASEGTLVWSSNFDGTFTFTPNPTFSGTVVIPYRVEDPFGLFATAEIRITISRLDLLLSGVQVADVTCTTQGSITVPEPTSGTGPYEYSLDNVTYQTGNVFSGLAVGNYTIYVKDANNCTANTPFSITNTCPGYLLTGIVSNDVNGLTDLTVNGIGTNAGGLNAVLVSGGNVVAVTAVDGTTGAFTFNGVLDGTYTVQLSTTLPTIGQPAPSVASLPLGWVSTGEFLGTGTGHDGLPANSKLSVTVAGANVNDARFGIQQPPIAGNGANSAPNPGYDAQVDIPANTFTNVLASNDMAPGTLTSIRINAFPTGARSIVIEDPLTSDFNIYYNDLLDLPAPGECIYSNCLLWPVGGITLPVDAITGEPGVYMSVDPTNDGVTQVIIPFVAIDNAGFESFITGNAVLNLTAVCDLTPRILLLPAVTNGTQGMEVTISIFELNNVATDGSPITVAISKNDLLGNFIFTPGQTENVNGDPINNSIWSFSQNEGFYIFTTSNVVEASGFREFAFKLTMTPGNTRGEFPLTVFLIAGSGGEVFFGNNDDDEVLVFFE